MRYEVFVLSCFFCCSACDFLQDNNLLPYMDSDDSSQQSPHASQATSYPYQQTLYFPQATRSSSQQIPSSSQQTPQGFLPPIGQQTQQSGYSPAGGNSPNILVQETCCRCSSGGSLISIPALQESSYNSELHRRCMIYSGACRPVVHCEKWKEQCKNSRCSANVLQQL